LIFFPLFISKIAENAHKKKKQDKINIYKNKININSRKKNK